MAYLEQATEGFTKSLGSSAIINVCAELLSELREVTRCGHGTRDLPFKVRSLFEPEDPSASIIDQPGWDPLQYE